MSGNGGQKNLEELKKTRPRNCYKGLPNDRLWIHPFVPHFPSSPRQSCGQKGLISTHSVQNSTLFGMKRGFVAVINTDITGKVPPLLTSNVPK